MIFHEDGTLPNDGEIFVFGSNLAGRHGAGAAKAAAERFGARIGYGVGPVGSSYAIPTKDERLRALSLEQVSRHIRDFLGYAGAHLGTAFFVTRIGCGLAGFRDDQIAPLFAEAPDNCSFAEQWREFVSPCRRQLQKESDAC